MGQGGGLIDLSQMVSEMGPVLQRVGLVQMRRSSVLSLLSLRKLWVSQVFIEEMQDFMWVLGQFWVDFVLMCSISECCWRSSGS